MLSNDDTPDYINNYFSTIGEELAGHIIDPAPLSVELVNQKCQDDFMNLEHLEISDVTLDQLKNEIANIDIYKSSGLDNMSSRFIKDAFSAVPEIVLHLMNLVLHTSIYPDAWKVGTVIPIPKVPNPSSVTDLRPITLLPIPGKILERLIHNTLYPYLEENGVLCQNQNGFRKQHGTPDTIFKLISSITDNLNEHKDTLALFIDVKKAFDTLNYDVLFNKLNKLNIGQNLKLLFKSYFTDRIQKTFINNTKSNIQSLTYGVPQGSILGPLFFTLYINDLPKLVSSKMLLYADDSVIFDSSNDESILYKSLQRDLNLIKVWCDLHKLTINIKKTKVVLFSNRKDTVYRNITLNNENIEHVTVFKYLGIHLDTRLGYHSQYKETYKLSSYKLLMLKRIRPFINENASLTILKTMLLPYLDMGNMFFTGLPLIDRDKLDTILNTGLRTVFNVRYPTEVHRLELYTRSNMLPLEYRRNFFLLNLVHRLVSVEGIPIKEPVRATRANQGPLVLDHFTPTERILKSPVFQARLLWNNLPSDTRNIVNVDAFKDVCKQSLWDEYMQKEIARITVEIGM